MREKGSLEIFLSHLIFVKRYSPHTITAYKTDLWQFQKSLKADLLLATRRDIRNFLMELIKSGYSLRTVNRKLEVLKSFYRYHWRHSNIDKSPCWGIRNFRFAKSKGRFIPVTELVQTLDAINPEENKKKLRDRLVLEILYFTGCRASEIINLKKEDIDYSKGQIKVLGKGRRERIVSINPRIIDLIKSHRAKWKHKNKGPFLLNDNRGNKIYPMFLWRLVRRYFTPEKFKINTSTHVLRHSIATHLYHNRAPLHSIKDFLGHRSLKTTILYLHFGPEHLKKVYLDAHPKELKYNKNRNEKSKEKTALCLEILS